METEEGGEEEGGEEEEAEEEEEVEEEEPLSFVSCFEFVLLVFFWSFGRSFGNVRTRGQ